MITVNKFLKKDGRITKILLRNRGGKHTTLLNITQKIAALAELHFGSRSISNSNELSNEYIGLVKTHDQFLDYHTKLLGWQNKAIEEHGELDCIYAFVTLQLKMTFSDLDVLTALANTLLERCTKFNAGEAA